MHRMLIFLAALGFLASRAYGFESFPHSQARLVTEFKNLATNVSVGIGLQIRLDPEWHTYWQNPGDSGAAPILEFSAPPGITLTPLSWPQPKRIEAPPLMTFGYEQEVLLFVEASVTEPELIGKVVDIKLDAEWLVCKTECIPAFGGFSVTLPVVEEKLDPSELEMFKTYRRQLPEANESEFQGSFSVAGNEVELWADTTRPIIDFFPLADAGLKYDRPVIQGQKLILPVRESSANVSGLLLFADGGSRYQIFKPAAVQESQDWQWSLLLFAGIGGLLLNLMPCVFPMISIKLLGFIKQGGNDSAAVRGAAFAYTMGVIVSFWVFAGLILIVRAGGEMIGWGFQLQSPGFLIFLCLLFVWLAFNFLGWFEMHVPIPQWTAGTQKGLLASNFLTGVLATLVAAPCTAPFMGVALGASLTQPMVGVVGIFTMLGVGFSGPYLVFALWPSMTKSLPKPGLWMVRLKEASAFPLFGTAIWLLWVLNQVAGMWAVFLCLIAILLSGMALWLKRSGLPKWTFLPVFGVSLLTAFSPLSQSTPDEGIAWRTFSEKTVAELQAQSRPVFIDFTADWCITCQVNDRVTFGNQRVRDFVQQENIVMFKADWTHRDANIASYLARYDRIGVPFYIFWPPDGVDPVMLPEILTPDIFLDHLKPYVGASKLR